MKKQIKEKLVKSACEVSDRKARVEKVASILKTVPYKTESDRLEATLSFARSTLNEQEIAAVVKPLRSDYTEAQIYRRGIA